MKIMIPLSVGGHLTIERALDSRPDGFVAFISLGEGEYQMSIGLKKSELADLVEAFDLAVPS